MAGRRRATHLKTIIPRQTRNDRSINGLMKIEHCTIADVAREAGVGVATVDRVINQRAAVRPATALRVLKAAEAIGFRGAGLIKKRISESGKQHRLGFLLQKRASIFFQLLAQDLAHAGKAAPSVQDAVIEFMDDLTPRRVVAQMRAMAARVDALALVATEHPHICEAIDELSAQGLPIFSLISDVSAAGRTGYVGIDNWKVGRTAAWAIANLSPKPGKIAIMMGSHRYVCQEQCEISFRSYFVDKAPGFQILETLISLDDRHLAEEALHELLEQHPDLTGLYMAGGGIEGVMDGLREHRPAGRNVVVTVCHELTPLTSAALVDGYVSMVISHPRELVAAQLVEVMLQALAGNGAGAARQVILPLQVFTPENI
jgi:LacI family transcriptional regulator